MAALQKRGERWRALVRKQGHPTQSKTFSTKEAARRWAREVERDIESSVFKVPRQLRRITVGALIERYRREMPPAGRTKAACLRMLEQRLADLTLDRIDKAAVVGYAEQRASEDGAGPATVAQDIIYLRGLLETARAHWDIPVSLDAVADARVVLRDRKLIAHSKERDRRPTDTDLETLRLYWERPLVRRALTAPMWDIVRFAIASCMRLSEICALRWEDIHERDRTILIRDRKHPTDKAGNDQIVPLLGIAWTLVQQQPRTEGEPRIFPYNPRSISTNFTRAVLRSRIDDLHFHDLRHHGISLLFEAGYQVQEVALVSGHRDWKQLRRYTQLRASDLHR